ncbi:MAG: hypothetical protein IKE24_08085 [Clostridia bacterium]|nr:hypothetical protein [Clostridia bacterium]
MKRWIACLIAVSQLLALGQAFALSKNTEGLYVDDNGQVIDESESEWGTHLPGYYIGEGVAYPIGGGDNSGASAPVSSDSSSGGMTVTSSDGSASGLPAGAVINPDGSVTIQSGSIQVDDGSSEGSGHLTQQEWAARLAKANAQLGVTTGIAYVDGNGASWSAEINALGLGASTVTINGQQMIVPTSSLVWDTEAPEDKLLAVVSTTKQTYATLRAKKSQKAFVMGHCDKCTVLLVINTGKTWTMVDCRGTRGYVLTSTLTFYNNQPKTYTPGIITVKGKTPRGNTVHVRSANKNTARQIAEYPVGTPIAVFSQEDKWSEIDVEGYHCYILSEFVTLQEARAIPDLPAHLTAQEEPVIPAQAEQAEPAAPAPEGTLAEAVTAAPADAQTEADAAASEAPGGTASNPAAAILAQERPTGTEMLIPASAAPRSNPAGGPAVPVVPAAQAPQMEAESGATAIPAQAPQMEAESGATAIPAQAPAPAAADPVGAAAETPTEAPPVAEEPTANSAGLAIAPIH